MFKLLVKYSLVEEESRTSDPAIPNTSPQIPVRPKRLWLGLVAAVILIIIFLPNLRNRPGKPANTPSVTASAGPSPSVLLPDNNFFLNSIPKPLSGLNLEDLPGSGSLSRGIPYQDKYFAVGDASVLVYSSLTRELLSYSNPLKAACRHDLVIIGDYLYVSCWPDRNPQKMGYTGINQEIYKINLSDLSLVRRYGIADGLQSGSNFQLVADGDILWIATYNGLGKIDTVKNRVNFYTSELGINNSRPDVDSILLDKDYVWFYTSANVYSTGGITLYDKSAGSFTPFNLRDFSSTLDRFDLAGGPTGGWKLVPGGIDIGFIDYNQNQSNRVGIIKRYLYTNRSWQTVKTFTAENIYTSINNYFSPKTVSVSGNSTGYSSLPIQNSDGSQTEVDVRGRTPLAISDIIRNHRYVLTTASIDSLSDQTDFPQIVMNLPSRLLTSGTFIEDSQMIIFRINPQDLTGFYFHQPWGGEDCIDQVLVTFDLNTKKVLKRFNIDCHQTPMNFPADSTTAYSDDVYIVKDSQGNSVFSLNMKSQQLSITKR